MTVMLYRIRACVAGGLLLPAAQACYDYQRVETAPPPGERVSLEITDRGRVALGDRFGPGLATVEGTLVAQDGGDYVIRVARVTQVAGSSALWSGEETRLNHDYVGTLRTRTLSKLRTTLLVGGIAAGVVALSIGGLSGVFSEAEKTPDVPPPSSIRIPVRP